MKVSYVMDIVIVYSFTFLYGNDCVADMYSRINVWCA